MSFFQSFCAKRPVVLHRWLQTTFREPSTWYEAQQEFTHTSAVMSMVGYILGLGDRHGENLLLHVPTGGVMHCDFSYIFWIGEKLRFPEIVPYRLTRNMVDAMGVLGVEAGFQAVCEVALALFRTNKDALLSVIEGFLYEPVVDSSKVCYEAMSPTMTTTNTFFFFFLFFFLSFFISLPSHTDT